MDNALAKKTRKATIERAYGAWHASKESGIVYIRKIRNKEEKRLKELFS